MFILRVAATRRVDAILRCPSLLHCAARRSRRSRSVNMRLLLCPLAGALCCRPVPSVQTDPRAWTHDHGSASMDLRAWIGEDDSHSEMLSGSHAEPARFCTISWLQDRICAIVFICTIVWSQDRIKIASATIAFVCTIYCIYLHYRISALSHLSALSHGYQVLSLVQL